MACRLDLAEIRVLSVRLRLENIDIDNVSVHQLIQGNWLMSCSCKVLDVKVGHVHNGLTLISSLVWWRTHCPRKWRKSRKGNPVCCSLLSYKKTNLWNVAVDVLCFQVSKVVWCDLQWNQSSLCLWIHCLNWTPLRTSAQSIQTTLVWRCMPTYSHHPAARQSCSTDWAFWISCSIYF